MSYICCAQAVVKISDDPSWGLPTQEYENFMKGGFLFGDRALRIIVPRVVAGRGRYGLFFGGRNSEPFSLRFY